MSHSTLLIVQMGFPSGEIRSRFGEQSSWFANAIGTAVDFKVVRPFLGEALPPPATFAAAIVTGSASMVTDRADWSERTARWILEVMAADKPMLGVCYGHQLMAHALGGVVGRLQPHREMGTYQITLAPRASADPLLRDLPGTFDAILTHQETVLKLPAGAVALGRSELDPHQIVRFSPHAFSVQFHPELTPELITAYIHARTEGLLAEGFDIPALLRRVKSAPHARAILRTFVERSIAITTSSSASRWS